MIKNFLLIIVVALCCTACTHAGPFVTNISYGKDEVVIEKCQILHNAWLGIVSTENCSTHTVKIK